MTLIVGLGNPGDRYKFTRHNAGFLAADRAIERLKAADASAVSPVSSVSSGVFANDISVSKKFDGEIYKTADVIVLKPLTFMNLSGKSVQSAANFYKTEKIIVIHDDLDLAFGALRFKIGGSSGGHNGLKSIDGSIGVNYLRVRMGIARPIGGLDAAEYVLSQWSSAEMENIAEFADRAALAAIALIENPLEKIKAEMSSKGIVISA